MRKTLRVARKLEKERKKIIKDIKKKDKPEKEEDVFEELIKRKKAIENLINKTPRLRGKNLKFKKMGDKRIILYQSSIRNTWCIIRPRMKRVDFFNREIMNKIINDEETKKYFPEYTVWQR